MYTCICNVSPFSCLFIMCNVNYVHVCTCTCRVETQYGSLVVKIVGSYEFISSHILKENFFSNNPFDFD